MTCVLCKKDISTIHILKHDCFIGYKVENLMSYGRFAGPTNLIDNLIEKMGHKENVEYLDEDAEVI